MSMIKRAVVIRTGAIGDCILVAPVLAAIRKRWPKCWIDLFEPQRMATLMLSSGLVDGFHDVQSRSLAGFYIEDGQLDSRCVDLFSRSELVLAYADDADKVFESHLKFCTRGKVIVAPPRPSEDGNIHCVDLLLSPLKEFGIPDADRVPQFRLSSSVGLPLTKMRTLAAHLGSGSKKKNWPSESWCQLLNWFLEHSDWKILLVGGESEDAALREISVQLPTNRIEIAQELPLDELARQMSVCDAFIGHDSGITHLAAALGLPVLAIWGATNESIWQPLGKSIRLVRGGANLDKLSVESVQAELVEWMKTI